MKEKKKRLLVFATDVTVARNAMYYLSEVPRDEWWFISKDHFHQDLQGINGFPFLMAVGGHYGSELLDLLEQDDHWCTSMEDIMRAGSLSKLIEEHDNGDDS